METINGVTFEDYAAACGNLAQGMDEAQLLQILEIEKPVWDETMEAWNQRLGELMTADMEYATKYGEIFANPRVGRFANGDSPASNSADLLHLAPNYEAYQKIFWHQSVASNYGIDPVTVIESYGINIGQWGALNMHYMNYQNDLLDINRPDYNEKFQYFHQLQESLRLHFEEYYKDNKTDLAADINF